jgi:hypothetical protein
MSHAPRWAYARARLMARQGERPDEAAWRAVEATTDAASYLLALRKTAAADWIEDVEADSPESRVETVLRRQWMDRVREISTWPPESWAPAVRWLEPLPYLAMVERALTAPVVPAGWREDPVVAEVMAAELERRPDALESLGWAALAPAAPGRSGVSMPESAGLPASSPPPPDVLAAWRAELFVRLPAADADGRADVERLVDWVAAHRTALARSSETTSIDLRRRLLRGLQEGFRRGASVDSAAGALFHYLGLVGFEGQRVRAGLLSRLELPRVREAQAWV